MAKKKTKSSNKYEKARPFLTEKQIIFLTEEYAILPNAAKSKRKRIAKKLNAVANAIEVIGESTHNFGSIHKAISNIWGKIAKVKPIPKHRPRRKQKSRTP